AARSTTRPAPKRPSMSWCSVRPWRSGTRIMARFACSVALRTASGTSRALPLPWPTRPLPSPTTTTAEKPKRRPPFTTLATRLMLTRRSISSPSWRSSPPPRCVSPLRRMTDPTCASEYQAARAGSIGQRLDPAVIAIAAAVEHHRLHPGAPGPLGDQFADLLGRRSVGAALEPRAQLGLQGRGGGERAPDLIVDHLRVDVLARAEHGQAGTTPRRPAQRDPGPRAAPEKPFGWLDHGLTSSCLPCAG